MKYLRHTLTFFYLCTVLLANADQSVTLAWDPNPEPDVNAYSIYYGNASRNYPYATNVGNVTTATVYGLKEGTNWFFAVTAMNTSGLESDFSNEVTNTIPSNVTNKVPVISPITNWYTWINVQAGPIPFTIGDVETPATNLVVTGTSTNIVLVSNSNIVFGGSGSNRLVTIKPTTNSIGTTLVTLVVSDGAKASSTSFILRVLPIPAPTEFSITKVEYIVK